MPEKKPKDKPNKAKNQKIVGTRRVRRDKIDKDLIRAAVDAWCVRSGLPVYNETMQDRIKRESISAHQRKKKGRKYEDDDWDFHGHEI